MIWNWQQPDWPEFTWNRPRFENAERAFLVGGGVIVGAVAHLDPDSENALLVEIYTSEAMKTSEIEGELLDRDSVQSSIRRQLGLASDPAKARLAEEGIATLMVDLYRHAAEPLTHETLFEWHRMLTQGRRDLRDIGRYRTHAEPMQVISGPLHRPTVHFEAPPSARVPHEMERFIGWFNRTAPGGGEPMPAITRAGIAHLYFVSVHPFEDGNGRIGRAIAEKALAQGLGSPTLTALADTIMLRRPEYYHELELANKRNELTPWLAWFTGITLESQRRTQARVDFTLDKARLLDRLSGQLNQRQEKALLRMFREGPEGFKGGLSAGNYHAITDAPPATATRDLADLVEQGALTRTGEKKHTRYHLAIPLRPVPRVTIADNGEVQG